MKTNVTYLNQKFNVNPKKNTVHCLLTWYINLNNIPGIEYLTNGMDEFNKYIKKYIDSGVEWYEDSKTKGVGGLKFVTKGIAKCAPGDNFDEKLGRHLALTRAQREAFNISCQFYTGIYGIINSIFKGIGNLAINSFWSRENCHKHECDLTGHDYADDIYCECELEDDCEATYEEFPVQGEV